MQRAGYHHRLTIAVMAGVVILHAIILWAILSLTPTMPNRVRALASDIQLESWPRFRAPEPGLQKLPVKPAVLPARLHQAPQAENGMAPSPQPDPPPGLTLPQGLVNALRGHAACQKARLKGETLSAGCGQADYASAPTLPSRPVDAAYWDHVVTEHEAYQTYKTAPGNGDYWRRVQAPSSAQDDTPRLGAYAAQKDQRAHDIFIQPDSAYQSARDIGKP